MTGQATTMDQVRWVANLHVLFTELPLLSRPAAARAAGFTEVEFWWPFDGQPRPSSDEVEGLVEAIIAAEVQLTAMNLYGGAMTSGDRGVVSHPDQGRDFRDSIDIAMGIGARLGTRLFNVPYGRRLDSVSEQQQDMAATEALIHAARAAEALDATVLVEPLSGFSDYPIKTSRAALEVIDRVRGYVEPDSIGFLMDQYHLATNGEDVFADLEFVVPYLRHVQVAEVPGRGAPGIGVRDFVRELLTKGYDGAVALEFVPQGRTDESLVAWRTAFDLT